MELSWLGEIKKSKRPVIILAEGLFMYLKEKEIKSLMNVFIEQFAGSTIIFDAFSDLEEEWNFSQSNEIKKMDFWYRLLFKVMNLFPIARKAHRIFVFRLEK